MAAIVINEPGTEFGPCIDEDCGHDGCKFWRLEAQTVCVICGDPIGYERRFCKWEQGLAHEVCIVKVVEHEK